MFAICAVALAAASGLVFGLFLPSIARADDPPPTTVSTPTLPTPDPAPAPKPKPKPTPKPAPKTTPAPRHVSPAPVYTPPVRQTPSTRPAATVKPKVRAHPKPKLKPKKVVPRKPTVKKRTTVLPKVVVPQPVGAVQSAFKSKSGGGGLSLGSLMIVLGLAFAITCFMIALVPVTMVKWRPAAIFVSERQVDLTVVGLALLVVAAFTFFLTKGP
jgi:hypothetical protein